MPGSDLDATDGLLDSSRPRPGVIKRIAILTAILLGGVILLLEFVSRLADGVVQRRTAAAGYDSKQHKPDVFDALALATIDPAAKHVQDSRLTPHPYLGYALKPSFKTDPSEFQQASHNSLGFRGKETTWAKPPGVFRIVTSGGSSVYGQSETRDAAVWSQRLEDHLNEKDLGYKVEVINGGAPGYNIFENLINFETRLVDFDPDLLIQYESINDMRCALYTRGGPVQRDNTQWRQAWPVDRPSVLERWFENSRAYLVWRRYFTNAASLREDLAYWAVRNYDPNGDPYDPDPVPDLGFQTYRRNLVELIAAARAHGTRVLIATQPLARYHLEPAPSTKKQLAGIDRIQDIQRDVGKEMDVPVFELARIIEAEVDKELAREVEHQKGLDPTAPPEELLARAKKTLHPSPLPKQPLPGVLFRHDVHPFDFGSDLIARTIADYLVGSGLVPAKH